MKKFYSDQYDYWADEMVAELYIKKKMKDYRDQALRKFNSVIPHPGFAQKIALSIIAGYRESLIESQDLIKEFDLDDMEMCAIEENFEVFQELYLEACERSAVNYYSEAI